MNGLTGRRAVLGAFAGGGAIMMTNEVLAADLPPHDASGIKAVVRGFESTWNRHDMDAFAQLFAPDAEWVNVVGMHWKGRDEVKTAHAVYHASFFKNNQLHFTSIQTRLIAPGVAVAVTKVSQSAFVKPDGQTEPARTDMLSMVLARRNGSWLIVHGQNTVIDPTAAPFDPAKGWRPS